MILNLIKARVCLSTSTKLGLDSHRQYINHGNGSPTVMSKILLPIELDTAISPSPILATITLLIRSGTLVPAARNVSPINTIGIPKVFPTISAHETIKYVKPPIHDIERIKDMKQSLFLPGCLTSGMVKHKTNTIGKSIIQRT